MADDGRRSRGDQSAAAGRTGDRSLGAGRLLRHRTTRWQKNADLEFERNRERYAFLKWGQSALDGFRAVPPDTGIVHQVNIEYLARVVFGAGGAGVAFDAKTATAYPDTAVGTDSHTTMVNGLGVLAWGVGGIEAEAAMLGQPVTMLIPEVIGFRLDGALREGVTATDLVLTITEMLRKKGVVGKFVEFFGKGLRNLPVADRTTIGNMSPEFGSTVRDLPDRRSHARLSAPHRPLRRARRARRSVRQSARAVPHRRNARSAVHRRRAPRSRRRRAEPRRPAPSAGSRRASATSRRRSTPRWTNGSRARDAKATRGRALRERRRRRHRDDRAHRKGREPTARS